MLNELYIENIAIIEKTSIRFENGFNVLTGETGAGKSILIGSINTILGERVSRDIVRTGSNKANVTAVFTGISHSVKNYLNDRGFMVEDGEPLIISREISTDGRSYCRILGRPSSVSTLRELGVLLMNIHGQHDNQELLSQDKHISFIDLFGELDKCIVDYKKSYEQLIATKARLDKLNVDEDEKKYKIQMLTYQINEIEAAALSENEETELVKEQKIIQNSTKILDSLTSAHTALFGDDETDDAGAVELLGTAAHDLEVVQNFLENSETMASRLREMYYETKELAEDMSILMGGADFDTSRINDVEERLDVIYKLKRKYGATVADVLSYMEKCKTELLEIEMQDENRVLLERQIAKFKKEVQKSADILTEKRLEAVDRFTKQVCEQLKFLDMPGVVLTYFHEKTGFRPSGQDVLYFLISTNAGETPKPLSKIASGGELSRIMLSIKNVMSGKDDVDTLIFDEIDTGVSGRAAQRIGEKLFSLSRSKQVICVTHLPQIAALADNHMLIRKEVSNGKTFTKVGKLDREGRKRELARIIGGDKITSLLLKNAEEMLKNARK